MHTPNPHPADGGFSALAVQPYRNGDPLPGASSRTRTLLRREYVLGRRIRVLLEAGETAAAAHAARRLDRVREDLASSRLIDRVRAAAA